MVQWIGHEPPFMLKWVPHQPPFVLKWVKKSLSVSLSVPHPRSLWLRGECDSSIIFSIIFVTGQSFPEVSCPHWKLHLGLAFTVVICLRENDVSGINHFFMNFFLSVTHHFIPKWILRNWLPKKMAKSSSTSTNLPRTSFIFNAHTKNPHNVKLEQSWRVN